MRAAAVSFAVVILLAVALGAGVLYALYHYGRGLPDYQQLADYRPPVVTRVHAGDGRLLAEYAVQHRFFVPVDAMPKRVIQAFLAAEDKNFYTHPGIDFVGVVRALVTNLASIGSERRLVGASTITQQVAKNFLLTSEVSVERKIREAILAFRIERAFSKDRILELYLNEIYLGFGSYGVAAAALNYFNKSLDELTIAEAALLAALPKAPSNYHPFRRAAAAKARRNWVIRRLLREGYVTPEQFERAKAAPLLIRSRAETEFVRADYFTEEVRRELLRRYGQETVYGGGLSVRTTVAPRLQAIAERALDQGLIAYDRRHGWRGPVARIDLGPGWRRWLESVEPPPGLGDWRLAVVLGLDGRRAEIGLADGTRGVIPMREMTWARSRRQGQLLGPAVERPSDVLEAGDVVVVEPVGEEQAEGAPEVFALRQVADVGGAIVAINPHTGQVLAMSGGYSFDISEFNRATQALRQPGSAFKPFVYLSALANGLTPASLVEDAPIVIDQGPGLPKWKPVNYTARFYGLAPLRIGLEQSRNLMTVRLARRVGMDKVAEQAIRLGVVDELPPYLPMALGAGETTLVRLTAAYAMFVNGGKRIEPALIERVQDRNGRTIYRRDERACPDCRAERWEGQPVPKIPDARPRVVDAQTAYQMVSLLRGVVERGTGRRVRAVGKPLAGKTGTTDEFNDAWFIGFSPDLAVGVFVGFDVPRTLGPRESGARVAAPIFEQFMREALADTPAVPFRIPPGIRLVRVDANTGLLPGPETERVILEAFKPGTEPTTSEPLDRGQASGLY